MATEKQGFGAKFFHWYESYQGKSIVNIVYSVGASVVIIGALFKILHWPGASQVLMVGMFTEAFLFLIGTLEHPHPEFHWENVFRNCWSTERNRSCWKRSRNRLVRHCWVPVLPERTLR